MMKQVFKAIASMLVIQTFCTTQIAFASVKIDTTYSVKINGIQQFISIEGQNSENPVMLFLHGGPGRSLMPFAESFTKKLQEKFVVVQWDQRGAGQTLQLNKSGDKITVDLLKSDALAMVRYLLKKFRHKKLYLVPHSWGSVMGFDIAYRHPELLNAYVPISPMIDAAKSSLLTINYLKDWAVATNNDTAVHELANVKVPYETEDDMFYVQKWLFIHNEVDGVKSEEFRNIYYKWMDAWFPVWKENGKTSLFTTVPELECPIYFFIGSGDNQTFYTIARDYYAAVKAKRKQLIWFEKSGHTIYNSEPEKIQQVLIEQALKETFY